MIAMQRIAGVRSAEWVEQWWVSTGNNWLGIAYEMTRVC